MTERLSDEEIRALMFANGFTVKPGLMDLKPYVYAAARAIESAVLARASSSAVRDAPSSLGASASPTACSAAVEAQPGWPEDATHILMDQDSPDEHLFYKMDGDSWLVNYGGGSPWEKSRGFANDPLPIRRTREKTAVPLSVAEDALQKLRDVLGFTDVDAIIVMLNATVRIKRLTAELAEARRQRDEWKKAVVIVGARDVG